MAIFDGPIFIGYKAWKGQNYLLNKMTFEDLWRAYITYPAVQVYAISIIAAAIVVAFTVTNALATLGAFALGAFLFPVAWYLIHRFVLHGSWMYKSPYFAKLWKRVHYDHHRYPNDLSVLFGGLHTTLPTIILVAGPVGFLIAGVPGAAASIAGTLVMTMITEFLHCGQHLAFEPKSKFWQVMKERHLAHHFHNENGNFGITEFVWDRVFGTFYETKEDAPRTRTARNL
ncbi:MAG: sterol desaturase family protein, partial [Pseudomonadota bacterium]